MYVLTYSKWQLHRIRDGLQGWEFEVINRLKKDASQFKKRPIKEYLEY